MARSSEKARVTAAAAIGEKKNNKKKNAQQSRNRFSRIRAFPLARTGVTALASSTGANRNRSTPPPPRAHEALTVLTRRSYISFNPFAPTRRLGRGPPSFFTRGIYFFSLSVFPFLRSPRRILKPRLLTAGAFFTIFFFTAVLAQPFPTTTDSADRTTSSASARMCVCVCVCVLSSARFPSETRTIGVIVPPRRYYFYFYIIINNITYVPSLSSGSSPIFPWSFQLCADKTIRYDISWGDAHKRGPLRYIIIFTRYYS